MHSRAHDAERDQECMPMWGSVEYCSKAFDWAPVATEPIKTEEQVARHGRAGESQSPGTGSSEMRGKCGSVGTPHRKLNGKKKDVPRPAVAREMSQKEGGSAYISQKHKEAVVQLWKTTHSVQRGLLRSAGALPPDPDEPINRTEPLSRVARELRPLAPKNLMPQERLPQPK